MPQRSKSHPLYSLPRLQVRNALDLIERSGRQRRDCGVGGLCLVEELLVDLVDRRVQVHVLREEVGVFYDG